MKAGIAVPKLSQTDTGTYPASSCKPPREQIQQLAYAVGPIVLLLL